MLNMSRPHNKHHYPSWCSWIRAS